MYIMYNPWGVQAAQNEPADQTPHALCANLYIYAKNTIHEPPLSHKCYLRPVCRSASRIASSMRRSSSSSRVSSSSVMPGSLRNGAGIGRAPAPVYTCGTCRASPYTGTGSSWYSSNMPLRGDGALASEIPREMAVRVDDRVVAVWVRRGVGPTRPV